MPKSPALAGLDVVLKRPSLVAAEVIWRWLFSIAALVLVFISANQFLHSFGIPNDELELITSGQPTLIADGLTRLVLTALPIIARLARILVPALAILWTLAATAGREAVLVAMFEHLGVTYASRPGLADPTLYILHFLRAASLLILVIGYVIAAAISSTFAGTLEAPNFIAAVPLFLAIFGMAFALWSVVHFVLALAPIFAVRDNSGTATALEHALQFARTHSRELYSAATVNGFFRLLVAVFITFVAFFPLFLIGTFGSAAIIAVEALLTIVYLLVSDALLVARLASYIVVLTANPASQASSL